jgi:hypothetical protein
MSKKQRNYDSVGREGKEGSIWRKEPSHHATQHENIRCTLNDSRSQPNVMSVRANHGKERKCDGSKYQYAFSKR